MNKVSSRPGGASSNLYCEIDGLQVQLSDQDLTSAGLFVGTTSPLDVDTELDIFLRSDAGEATVSAQVVQSISCDEAERVRRTPGYGVLFTHLTYNDRIWLGKTVELLRSVSQAPEPKPPARMPPVGRRRRRAHKTRDFRPKRDEDEVNDILVRLRNTMQQLVDKSPESILGIESGSDNKTAKAAFFRASKKYHPHLYARHDSEEIDGLVTEIFIAHKRAYEAIAARSKPPPAAEPTITTSDPPAPGVIITARPPARPPARPSKAPKADAGSAPATSATPNVARLLSMPAPALHAAPPAKRSQRPPRKEATPEARAEISLNAALKLLASSNFAGAEKELQRALSHNPGATNVEIWLLVCRARRAKADGRSDESNGFYLDVLRLDPKNHEALAATEQTPTRSTGRTRKLFGKIFGPEGD